MNKEKLDTLLRNKLQWHESEVQEAELNAVFDAMGINKKRKKILWPYWSLAIVSIAMIVSLFFISNTRQQGQASGLNSEQQAAASINTKGGSNHKTVEIDVQNDSKMNDPLSKSHAGKSYLSDHMAMRNNGKASDYTFYKNDMNAAPAAASDDNQPLASTFEWIQRELRTAGYKMFETGIKDENKVLQTADYSEREFEKSKKKTLAGIISQLGPQIGFWTAPMINFHKINVDPAASEKVHTEYSKLVKESENPLFSISSGFEFQLRLVPFLNFSSGIAYFRTGNSYNYDYRINLVPIIDSASNKIVNYIKLHDSSAMHIAESGRRVLTYVEIPLRFRFNLYSNDNIKLGIEPAYTLQFLSSEKGNLMNPVSLQLQNKSGIRTRSSNIQLALPLSFGIDKQFGFTVSPFAGRSLRNISTDNLQIKKIFYGGLRFTLNYTL